jgi:hypothetical protein
MGTLSFAGIFRVAPNDNITAKFLEVSKKYRDYIILGISPTSFRENSGDRLTSRPTAE